MTRARLGCKKLYVRRNIDKLYSHSYFCGGRAKSASVSSSIINATADFSHAGRKHQTADSMTGEINGARACLFRCFPLQFTVAAPYGPAVILRGAHGLLL